MSSLASVLDGVLDRMGLRHGLMEHRALAVWAECIGPSLAGRTAAIHVRQGVLLVAVDSPAWASELSRRKKELLGRLATRLGERVIMDIRFKNANPRAAGETQTGYQGEGPRAGAVSDQALTAADLETIKEFSAMVEDGAMRESVGRLRAAALRLEHWKKANDWSPCAGCGVLAPPGAGLCPECQRASKT